MLFNSFKFLIFFPIVCLIYFLIPGRKLKNCFLLVASYYFYICWQPIFALLLLGTTAVTYFGGIWIESNENNVKNKKWLLTCVLVITVGALFIFKYFNFVNGSIFSLMDQLGLRWRVPNLKILLPVGISFYTFQSIGYSIDVYRGNIKAERSILDYALFISFFPYILSGLIERAGNLLPQIHEEHKFDYERMLVGFRTMLWGYFMKLCVADRLGLYVDAVYNNVGQHNGTTLALATVLYAFQIYCDFGGYSLIAIGAAKVMGFDLKENFHRPYLSKNIREFWQRWHISLSSWLRDYLYIPLGGNRVPFARNLFNLAITFIICGIWHGANWTFLVWGAIHGLYQIIRVSWKKIFPAVSLKSNIIIRIIGVVLTFILVDFAWIFFRANSISDAFEIVSKMFTDKGSLFVDVDTLFYGILGVLLIFIKDCFDEYFPDKILFLRNKHLIIRYLGYVTVIAMIMLFGVFDGSSFIYFQF